MGPTMNNASEFLAGVVEIHLRAVNALRGANRKDLRVDMIQQ